jgi:uncharacterized protein (TIGR02145 family)
MKQLNFLITFLLLTTLVKAQTPQGFNYSAVARDATGKPLANRNVSVQLSILKTSPTGALQYAENHLANTDGYGLFNLVVGNGNVITGNLTTILWGSANHYLKVAIDANGGSNYITMGTTQLMSVPYAMYSQNGLQSGTTTGEMLYWNGTNWLPITPGNQAQTLTFCDGKPTWTTAGQCPGTLAALNCGNPTNNGTLISGSPANSVSSSIFYTGGGGGNHNGQTVTSTGITGLTATLLPGSLVNGSGILTYNITGTPSTSGTASFAINIGGQTCTLTRTVEPPVGTIVSIDCATAINTGTLTPGSPSNNITSSILYTGGNGGAYNSQTINSTGITGLTASLSSGTFANGNGTLVFNITGTPLSSGTANFSVNVGGQTCTLNLTVQYIASQYPVGSVFCNGPTTIIDITNPSTGKTWMDRNLGAAQAATSSTDANSYGDLYQWGRFSDGHQCRNSATTSILSSSDQPGHGNFIKNQASPYDWKNPQNENLWQGVNGINNPCPIGYRLPTETEWNVEVASFNIQNSSGAFDSPLKLTLSGRRDIDGLINSSSTGCFWSSTVTTPYSRYLLIQSNFAGVQTNPRVLGYPVRCIKD